MTGHLLDEDHDLMDRHLERTFDCIRSGHLSRSDFVERMAHLITAVDLDAYEEVRRCFRPRPDPASRVLPYRLRAVG